MACMDLNKGIVLCTGRVCRLDCGWNITKEDPPPCNSGIMRI